MRKCIFLSITIFVIISCANRTEHNYPVEDSVFRALDRDAVDYFYSLPLDSFSLFQTFDEYKMEGVGRAEQHPFVYFKKTDEHIIVRRSDEPDSLIIYQRAGKYWINYHWENFELFDSFVCKHGSDRYATKYSRILFNDTILELRQIFINGVPLEDLIINSHNKVVVLRLMDDIKDTDTPFEEMIKIKDFFSIHKSLEFYNKKYMGIKRFAKEYMIYKDNEYLRFCCWDKDNEKELKFKVTPLHYYGIYPDF